MIKGITGGRGIIVSGGNNPTTYINMNNPSAGMVRYNGNSNNVEVYDGMSWLIMQTSYANIELDADTQLLIEWARKKRNEEVECEQLAKTNPAIRDLIDQIKQKEDQLKMVRTLLKSPGNEPQELMGS